MFQFHIGAIKSSLNSTGVCYDNSFQFHIGAIKRQIFTCKNNNLH